MSGEGREPGREETVGGVAPGQDPAPVRRGAHDPGSAPGTQSEEAWLRYDAQTVADRDSGLTPRRGAAADVPDPDQGYAARSAPQARGEAPPGRHRRPQSVGEDWASYAAAAPSGADDEDVREGTADGSGGGTDGTDGGADGARAAKGPQRHGPLAMVSAAVKEFVIVVAMALILSFVVKTWVLQAFYIPSGSMEDTLVLNDRVIVSKLQPGPFEIERGDIVVFADPGDWLSPAPEVERGPVVTNIRRALMFVGLLPDDAENHLIKRVIGLPGDRVVCCDEGERITVNGAPLDETYLKPGDAPSSQDFDVTVPEGSLWVMGDHRSDSSDSRFHDPGGTGEEGSVPESLVVGRAVALVWPLNHLEWLSTPEATFARVPNPPAQLAR